MANEIDPDVPALITLFNSTFASFSTRLVLGDDEPVYLPASKDIPYHRIVFAHGFFSSALHEIAHWCVAGEKRRLLEDYGYWYCPDGRDAQQQAEFESVEIKPQAIEWAFTQAAGRKFQVSTDNLNGAEPDREGFARKVEAQLMWYKQNGFPPRAACFINALSRRFTTTKAYFPQLGSQLVLNSSDGDIPSKVAPRNAETTMAISVEGSADD